MCVCVFVCVSVCVCVYIYIYMSLRMIKFNTHAVVQLVQALLYKPVGRGFDSRLCLGIFHSHNPSGHTMTLRSIQPLTEMSTTNTFCGVKAAGA